MSEQDDHGRRPSMPSRTTDSRLGATSLGTRGATGRQEPGAPEREDGAPGGAAGDQPPSDRAERSRRLPGPAWLPWAVGGVVALVVVVVAVLLLTGDDAGEPATPAAVEVVGPEPTPAAEPVVRGEGSALFLALPDSVRQYSLASIAPSDAFAGVAALESVTASYSGPLEGSEVTYDVVVGQWPTPAEAAAQALALVGAAPAPTSAGEVTVGGAVTGTFSISSVDDTTATATWTNGTVLLQATGPAADVENFYLAFSL